MARTASLTPSEALEACRSLIGLRTPSDAANINSGNRSTVRQWLVAEGLPSTYVQGLTIDSLKSVYGDNTNATLAQMKASAGSSATINGRQADFMILDEFEGETTEAHTATRANDADAASRKLAEALSMITALQGGGKLDEKRVGQLIAERLHIVRDELVERINKVEGRAPLVIEVRQGGDLMGRIEGHHHPKFATLLKAATAKDATGHYPNIWISGPAGSGKTRAVSDCCKALGIGFEHNGALSMPHELTGFIDAGGNYHPTPFYKSYGAACGYLFDEVDASDNAALLALNAALANGHASFPSGILTRHQDNRIFVAANTWGHGATADYVGRAKIDAAFLDRFPVKIHFDYDEELERAICGNPDWAIQVQAARAKAKAVGLKVAITPRASIGGAALIAAGFTKAEAAELTYMAPLTADQRRQIAA